LGLVFLYYENKTPFMKTLKLLLFLFTIGSLTSCATSYVSIKPESQKFISSSTTNNIKLEYKYDLLTKKYARREYRKDIKVVAIKVTNNSENDLEFGKDFSLAFNDGRNVELLDTDVLYKKLKQRSGSFLWYLYFAGFGLQPYSNTDNNSSSLLVLVPVLSSGLAFGNYIVAYESNNEFKDELKKYEMLWKKIPKGESKVGIIGIWSGNHDGLVIKMK
jgi:hypothetical protein